jgi:site-specific DNA recombinase
MIEEELNRRLEAAQNAAPTRRRRDTLERDLTRVRKSIERLMTAYQEDLLSLDELRSRLPELRQRERAIHAELQSIGAQEQDRAAYLRLAETLSAFLGRLRSSAETLDVLERQRIVRLLVKEVLVSDDAIVIRHSIPVTAKPPRDEEPRKSSPSGVSEGEGYLLRSGRTHPALRRPRRARHDAAVLHLHGRLQPALDVEQNPATVRMMPDRLEHELPIDAVEGRGATLPITEMFRPR